MKIFTISEQLSEKMKRFAPIAVRVAISLVFLWFGSEQLKDAGAWAGIIPSWATSLSGMSAITLVYLNGASEIIFGILLLAGFFTRLAALFLALKLFGIMYTIGYNDVGVRDFGLAMATLSIFLNGADAWSLDKVLKPKVLTI